MKIRNMKKKFVGMSVCILMFLTSIALTTTVVAIDNLPPEKPILNGETEGRIGIEYKFISDTTDPEDDFISYWFTWGDGNNTGWIMPYVESGTTAYIGYTWNDLGVYNVKVKAKDVYGHESAWSDTITISIINDPPEIPVITGTVNGRSNTVYGYTFVTTDPQGDSVSYFIDWGDGSDSGWIPFFASGAIAIDNHLWNEPGNYNVIVKAKDIYEEESEWSDPFVVHISDVSICMGESFSLNISATNNGAELVTFDWEISMSISSFLGQNSSGLGFILSGGVATSGSSVSLLPDDSEFMECTVFGIGHIKIDVVLRTNNEIIGAVSANGILLGRSVFVYQWSVI